MLVNPSGLLVTGLQLDMNIEHLIRIQGVLQQHKASHHKFTQVPLSFCLLHASILPGIG